MSWKRVRRVCLAIVLFPIVLVLVMAVFTPLPAELREPAVPSLRVLSRDGKLLREVRTDDGVRARPLPLSSYPSPVQDAVLAAEDRRFRSHFGVDVIAVLRAAGSNLVHGRIVSGASTITMQLARTLRPHSRTLWGKMTEVSLALRIEASLSKDKILEEYLNRVTYGPNLRGYAAASHAYFGMSPESLSLAEAALLAGLPRGPSLYDVTKRPQLAKKRRDRVLERMLEAKSIDADAKQRAQDEALVLAFDKPAFGAPHLVRALAAKNKGASEITTTIDGSLQRTAEAAVRTSLMSVRDKHVTAAAAVVIDNATGDVLAYVGSPDFFDERALGQNDGVTALRQPGSALKPFVYAEAMSKLGYTGATLLPDVELHIPLPGGGDYVPHDYDTKLRGPVRLREALGNSLNVPAVYTIHRVGTQAVLDRLHAFGFGSLTDDAEHYGPALALGDGEVTLLELANAYATLAREGTFRPLRTILKVDGEERTMGATSAAVEPRIAAMVTDILRDKSARTGSFGDQNVLEGELEFAAKTGTSKGYRDNVAVGYTRAVTVAAWAGNFDASPMTGVSGITGAGPILRAIMDVVGVGSKPDSLAPDGERLGLARTQVCALSGDLPTASCPHRVHEWMPEGNAEHGPHCTTHAIVRLDKSGRRAGACPDTTTQVLERWEGSYAEWARSTGRAVVPSEASPDCPPPEEPTVANGPLRISYPFEGARFVIDPERDIALQLLEVKLEPDAPSTDVAIDDVTLPKSRAWQLAPGAHTITAGAAAAIHFTVR